MKRPIIGLSFAAWAVLSPADAAVFRLEIEGFFQPGDALNQQGEALDTFGELTAFNFTAVFDDQGTVYRAGPPGSPLPGYAAYDFRQAQLEVDGVTYEVASFGDNPVNGVAVALFDPTNVFNPGFNGVGFFGNPESVGPGLIARFGSSSPAFSAVDPSATEFSDYLGYGALSGPTIDPGPGFVCQTVSASLCATVPIFLTGPGGELYDLTLLSNGYDGDGSPVFAASLAEVPVPGALVLFGTALAGIGAARTRRHADSPDGGRSGHLHKDAAPAGRSPSILPPPSPLPIATRPVVTSMLSGEA
jgi:hypothetical protein